MQEELTQNGKLRSELHSKQTELDEALEKVKTYEERMKELEEKVQNNDQVLQGWRESYQKELENWKAQANANIHVVATREQFM